MPGLLLGDVFPNFEAETTNGQIKFHDFLGDSWGILFSHPRDYTPVCTTELGRAAKLSGDQRELAVFVIGQDKKLKLSLLYPATTGRNFDEILRVVDSLQLTAKNRVATPADWQPGERVMVPPNIPEEEAAAMFTAGIYSKELPSGRKYLRYTPQP
ncbi:unnamed protein product [Coregonus sp. 'balchen']|nr:unnamed protein product [Coregonus sp. 'balchen']